MNIIPVRLIYGFFRGIFTGDWEVFKSSLRFWATCLGSIFVLALAIGFVSTVALGCVDRQSQPPAPTLVWSQSVPPTAVYSAPAPVEAAPTWTPPLTLTPQAADSSIRSRIVYYSSAKNLYVCTDAANVRRGPGTKYSAAYQQTRNTPTKAYGYIGEWFYVGYDTDGTDLFMHQSVLCTSYVPAVQSTQVAPEPVSSGCPTGCTVHISGCDIKGNISFNTGEKIYHVPGGQYYDATVIDPRYGERWFCTEAEAQANGWRRSER